MDLNGKSKYDEFNLWNENFSVRYFKYNFMNNIHLKLLRFPAVLLAQGNLKK